MSNILYIAAVLASAEVPPCILPSVQKPPSATQVIIGGAVSNPFTLGPNDTGRFKAVKVRISQPSEYGPIEGEFEGVSIVELLRAAGPATPASKAGLLDTTVSAQASDGYTVAFSYSETDPELVRAPAFVAFSCNGRAISPTVVAPGDIKSTRYVHELAAITLHVPRQ